jgi:TonB family protein
MSPTLERFTRRCRTALVALSLLGFISAPQIASAQDSTSSGGAVKQGGDRKIKSKVTPDYPDVARKMHISGTVRVEATVEPDGKVRDARILGGSPLLGQEVINAVKKWRYEEATKETVENVEITFQQP